MSTVAARFPDKLRGIIDRKLLKLLLYVALSEPVLFCTIGGSDFGNNLHISGSSDTANRPKALANPISTGTVILHKYSFVELEQLWFCSCKFFMDVTKSMRHSTWVVIISSLELSHLAAMSLNKVWMQKLSFSATGIPKKVDIQYKELLQ